MLAFVWNISASGLYFLDTSRTLYSQSRVHSGLSLTGTKFNRRSSLTAHATSVSSHGSSLGYSCAVTPT